DLPGRSARSGRRPIRDDGQGRCSGPMGRGRSRAAVTTPLHQAVALAPEERYLLSVAFGPEAAATPLPPAPSEVNAMNRPVRPFVLALIAVAMASPAQGGAPPQPPAADKQPPPDKEVADKLTALKEVVNDRKTARDGEGCDVIAVLLKKWEAGLND